MYRNPLVWSPDGWSFLFWSGALTDMEGHIQDVGDPWLGDVGGGARQLTHLGSSDSPLDYQFLPSGDRIVLTTSRGRFQMIDREGRVLISASPEDLPGNTADLITIPAIDSLLLAETSQRSATDPDGLWAVDMGHGTVVSFAELYNEGQTLAEEEKRALMLEYESVTISDFAWASGGRQTAALISSAIRYQLPTLSRATRVPCGRFSRKAWMAPG
jgi:hypothetical protein